MVGMKSDMAARCVCERDLNKVSILVLLVIFAFIGDTAPLFREPLESFYPTIIPTIHSFFLSSFLHFFPTSSLPSPHAATTSSFVTSAAMLAAFEAAVVLKSPQKLHLVLCLAENAIGPKAMRNDDILRLLSGKTVRE